jgi:hypothetical protein
VGSAQLVILFYRRRATVAVVEFEVFEVADEVAVVGEGKKWTIAG